MKKYLLYFSLLVFHFSLCKAQDTLVYKTGEKVGVKVISINGGKVIYTLPPDEKQLSVNQAKLYYVKYKDGSRYSISPNNQSIRPTYPRFNIGAGIGVGLITWALPNSNVFNFGGDESYDILTVSPAYNLTLDYNILKTFSWGICGAYQTLTDHPAFGGTVATFETERISRYNVTFRFLGHLSKNPTHYAYLGTRFGASIWTDKVTAFIPPSRYDDFPYTSMPSYSRAVSLQLFFGYRGFVSDIFGFHFEIAIGSPYVLEAGITFRFKTKKNNE